MEKAGERVPLILPIVILFCCFLKTFVLTQPKVFIVTTVHT